jgi:uncharacterized protein YggT (Ycf19 family)
MSLINFILDIVGLLLWLNWLSLHFDPLAKTSAATLVGTLRKADPSGPRRWQSFAAVIGLVVVRAVIYWQIGPALNWTPRLSLAPVEPPFRSDLFWYVLLFSVLSLVCTLAVFYFSLLLLSVANQSLPDNDPLQKLVRQYFNWFERWPTPVKLLLPLLAGALFWIGLHPLLTRLAIVPPVKHFSQLVAQAAIIGAGTYLSWKYMIIGVLCLHMLNSYVYLGDHPMWNYINVTARHLLYPLRPLPLRLGKIDLLPLVGILLILATMNFLAIADYFSPPSAKFRPWFYQHLPF